MYRVTFYVVPPPTSVFTQYPPMVVLFAFKDRAEQFAKEIVEVGPASMAITEKV